MLEGVDAAAEFAFERPPVVVRMFLQIAEAPGARRRGAVKEYQQRAFLGVIRKVFTVDIQKVGRLARAPRPAIQTRFSIEGIFHRPHERLGAQPANAEPWIRLDLVLGLLTEPFGGLALRRVDNRIGDIAHRENENSRNQIAHGIADDAARRLAALAQRV